MLSFWMKNGSNLKAELSSKESFITRRAASGLLLATALASFATQPFAPLSAQDAKSANAPATASPSASRPLPAEVVTDHQVGVLRFKARAGAIRLNEARTGAPLADLAYISYEAADADPTRRPVVFALNGGPGAASAWLHLGAIGPWRIRMDAAADVPSAAPRLLENGETWLPFADLVLIDTPGTGYSAFVADSEGRSPFYSVDGDIDGIAVFIRQWLIAHGRMGAPKFIVAESYGGIRGPRLVARLAQHENVGVRGLFLVSPVLNLSFSEGSGPMVPVSQLPSFAALARGARNRAAVADAEAYAAGDFLADYLKGPRDEASQARLAERVSAFTGFDPAFVRQGGGRVERANWARTRRRATGEVLSLYDGTVAAKDPAPADLYSDWDDPMLDSLRAPLGAAMTLLVTQTLKWPIGEARYDVLNGAVLRRWDWGRSGRAGLESMSALRSALAADPAFKLVVAHGLYDLVTPYFASKLLLDGLPAYADASRVRLVTAPSGHMLYSSDGGRALLRDEARALIEPAAP